jgi:hypothetical protein
VRGPFPHQRRSPAQDLGERPDILHCDNTHTSPLIGAWLAGVKIRLWTKHAMEPAFEAGTQPGLRDRLAVSLRVSTSLATKTLATFPPGVSFVSHVLSGPWRADDGNGPSHCGSPRSPVAGRRAVTAPIRAGRGGLRRR